MALISQAAARYRPDGGREHCSICRHFIALRGGGCKRVEGRISPRGWCRLFSQEVHARIPDVTAFSGVGGGPALGLDFMVPGVLDPRITFTRASTATYFNSAGVMQTAAINAPRWDYDPATLQLRGLLLEDQRTNGIRNSTMVGAVPGTPGTPPTNWVLTTALTGLSSQIVGTGTEDGIPYLDLRISGTAGSTGPYHVLPEATTTIAAANGQAWTYTTYWRLVAGTLNGIASTQLLLRETTAAGALVKDDFGATTPIAATPLRTQRTTMSVTLTGGGTVGAVHGRVVINITTGVAIDATFRIGAPQIELGDFATSYIPTTTVAVTRSIDSCLILPANMAPWFTPPGGSWFAEFRYLDATPANGRIVARPIAGGSAPLMFSSGGLLTQTDGTPMTTANAGVVASVNRGVSTWSGGSGKLCLNGGVVAVGAMGAGYGGLATFGVGLMTPSTVATENVSGHIRALRYWPTALSDAQMQAMTA